MKAMTPVAREAFPEGTDFVQVDEQWYLILWNDTTAIAGPEADGYIRRPADDELEPYIPPNIYVRDLIEELSKDAHQ